MDSQRMRPTRYAHFEGHTDICYTEDGRYMVTCGSDGEVRVFDGLDDDDFKTHVVAECASAVACKEGRILVGTESNLVQAYTLDEGSPDGIITRFTAPPTHIVVSPDGKLIACASSDMTIRLHDPVAYKDKVLTGHQAPVLSLALDPKGEYLASSSCDGSVRIWVVGSSAIVATWQLIPKTNSFSASPTLCRMTWTRDGKYIAVPVESKIHFYSREDWQLAHELSDEAVTSTISVVTISPCGKFIAGGCKDGTIVVWDVNTRGKVITEKHPKGLTICGLVWNPSGKKELAFVDINGQFGTVENVIDGNYVPTTAAVKENGVMENGIMNGDVFPPLDMGDDDDEDDGEFSIAKIKSNLGFADDEEGTFLGLPANDDMGMKAVDDDSRSAIVPRSEAPAPSIRLPEIQRPFQPSMSPEHLNDRYMVWNNVGIVRQYSTENEEAGSVEVEFHDTSVHHALHLSNSSSHTMATLSNRALVLACEARDDQPSKVWVQHFGAWGGGGSNKEWHVDLPEGEEVVGVCTGSGWVAAATDQRNLRVFSTAGVQRDVLAIPGPLVCLAGFEDLLMVVFHSGMGVSGDQHMSALVLSVGGSRHPVPLACPIPLSPRSFLAWAGFSDEGTPVTMDSSGIVRIMHYKFGYTWTPILNTKSHTRGKSDHYFLLGLSETQGSVRCILCKGSRFPPVLPKPHVSIINLKVPLCEAETEKGELEEQTVRNSLLLHSFSRLASQGYDVDSSKDEADRILKEAMIKLFALACRSDKEARALEVCQLMPSQQTVGLAIKYAGKLRKIQLAEKLGEVAEAKMVEEMEQQAKEAAKMEDDFHEYGRGKRKTWEENAQEEDDNDWTDPPHLQDYPDLTVDEDEEEMSTPTNPLLAAAARREGESRSRIGSLLSPSTKNPFKKNLTPTSAPSTITPSSSSSSKRGIDVIDQFRKSQKKTDSSPVLRPVVKKSQGKQQTLKRKPAAETEQSQQSLSTPSLAPGKENQSESQDSTPQVSSNPFKKQETPSNKKQSALQLWLEDNEEEVKKKYPDAAEKELLAKAALMFKDLESEVKQKYKTLAANTVTPSSTPATPTTTEEEKKRKIDEDNQESPAEKKVKGSGISKLAGFAFSKPS